MTYLMLNISEYEIIQLSLFHLMWKCFAKSIHFLYDLKKKYYRCPGFNLLLLACSLIYGNISDVIVARTICPKNTSRFLAKSRCIPWLPIVRITTKNARRSKQNTIMRIICIRRASLSGRDEPITWLLGARGRRLESH